jgi:hypothetical protein
MLRPKPSRDPVTDDLVMPGTSSMLSSRTNARSGSRQEEIIGSVERVREGGRSKAFLSLAASYLSVGTGPVGVDNARRGLRHEKNVCAGTAKGEKEGRETPDGKAAGDEPAFYTRSQIALADRAGGKCGVRRAWGRTRQLPTSAFLTFAFWGTSALEGSALGLALTPLLHTSTKSVTIRPKNKQSSNGKGPDILTCH